MYNSELLLTLLLINSFGFAQVKYEQYFIPKTLRIDFYETGNSTEKKLFSNLQNKNHTGLVQK